ncbi:hypothetical protein QOZ80_5AG0400840 [Eleusine coracana subsp. coracana]|nr:hypothetical protein QOZ80_5AG0400840 [Eleusine coracana subsp. coracana]
MSGPDLGGRTTPGWARSPAPPTAENAGAGRSRPARGEKRVVLGDLTNIAVGRLGAVDAGKGIDESRNLKPSLVDIEFLKGRLLEEQQPRERAEAELSKLKEIQAIAQLASCIVLPSDKPDDSSYANTPQHFVDSEKQTLSNLNKAGEATLVKERAESANEEFAAISKGENRPREDHAMLPEQETRDGDGTSLKDMSSRMDMTLAELESTIDTLNEIITQQQNKFSMMNERLIIEERKVTSLEQERDQLCSEVAILKSKVGIPELGYGDHSVSKTEELCMVNTPVVDSVAQTEVKKIAEWLPAVEELKGQLGSVKKQPVLIEICDDEETSIWYDDDKKPSDPSISGEQGGESFQQMDSYEWFFRGNKLMLSSGMKKHLKEICCYVPPEIPFYIYQMNRSNLKPKGRMRLSAKYTSAHLLSFFHRRESCTRLEVDGEDCGAVRIILGRDGRASLSSEWQGVVEAKNIKVGDICAFHFKVSNGDLKLAVHMFHVARYLVSLR